MEQPRTPAGFPTTHWSRVARAGDPRARGTVHGLLVSDLCPDPPQGAPPDEALDLTQGYFARLMEKGTISAADPARGRFRAFLRADCGFFLADPRDRDRALKRGGGRVLSIDARDAEGRYRHEPAHDETPERLFDRDWAVSLIDRAMERLERHYQTGGRAESSAAQADPDGRARRGPLRELAADLRTTEGALRTAVHRLRTRFADGSGPRSPRPSTTPPPRRSTTSSATCSPRSGAESGEMPTGRCIVPARLPYRVEVTPGSHGKGPDMPDRPGVPTAARERADGLCPRCLISWASTDPASARGDGRATARPPSGGRAPCSRRSPPRSAPCPASCSATPPPARSPADPPAHQRPTTTSTRYRIDGEIARGGMGAVLKGRDPDLGRDVAIKVLREDLRDNPDMVRRFVEEAQIGGQLQHPGIVPIYELGTFADRRPFFSMKLVKGHTLAELLAGRPDPGRRPAPLPGDLRGDRPDGGLRPRPRRDPPRPEAVERDGRLASARSR